MMERRSAGTLGVALALALAAVAGAAAGAEPAAPADRPRPPLAELVVTASRLPRLQSQAGSSVTLLRARDAPPVATLGDLLANDSDIDVQRPGGAAGVASIYLRGADPNFTPVMLEGVPLNDPTNTRGGSVDVSAIDALGLQRVEVVRGALSAVYGSGSLSGAVNLILPSGTGRREGAVTLVGGTDRSLAAGLTLRGPVGGEGAVAAASLTHSDAGDAVPQSSRRNDTFSTKITPLDGSDAYGLVLRLSRSAARAFPDESGGPRLAVLRTTETRRSDEGLVAAHVCVALSTKASLELTANP
jgi:vitamin B12 transporter